MSDSASPAGSPHTTTLDAEKGRASPEDHHGLDLQVALDQLTAGSTDALRLWMAQVEGLDPDTVQLSEAQPWVAPEDGDTSNLSFIGQLDNVDPPDTRQDGTADVGSALSHTEHALPSVAFAEATSPFVYNSLRPGDQEFRLLRLGPKDEQGFHREFQLRTFRLSAAPRFFCLSYVWGIPDRVIPVTCNGQLLFVTQNLFHALQTCFNRYSEEWLWADGVCINQDDLVERAQQVQVMGSIYQRALMVLANPGNYLYKWKGRDSGDIDTERLPVPDAQDTPVIPKDAFASTGQDNLTSRAADKPLLRKRRLNSDDNAQKGISLMTLISRVWASTSEYSVMSDLEWAKWGLPADDDRETWGRLLNFWAENWFFRAWVLQEIVLAKKVVVLYNGVTISLDAVVDFWDGVKKHGLPRMLRIGGVADQCDKFRHLSCVNAIKKLRARRAIEDLSLDLSKNGISDNVTALAETKRDGTLLLELLRLSRNNLATDARDKVYSVLGMVNDPVAQAILPDYSPDNDAGKVFIDVAVRLIEAGHSPDLLHHAGVDRKTPGLPSWAPDWTFQSRSALSTTQYQCTGRTMQTVSILSDTTTNKHLLQARGVILAPITFAGPAWRYYSHDPEQDPFAPFKSNPEVEIPPFNDEDARNFILTMALNTGEDGVPARYASEGWENAVARTMAADCSWRGERIGPAPKSAIGNEAGKEADKREVDAGAEFFNAFRAFHEFYTRGPESEEDLDRPGVRVHQTCIFQWLLEFDEEKEADLQRRMVPFTSAMQEAQRGRRFAVLGSRGGVGDSAKADKETSGAAGNEKGSTDQRFIAVVPWDAEKEDLVVLFEGFATPFVLRPCAQDSSGSQGSRYELVGDCYVHGIMDGELFSERDQAIHTGTDFAQMESFVLV